MEVVESEEVTIYQGKSHRSTSSSLILSARNLRNGFVNIVVGRAGMPNLVKEIEVGDAIIYETPDSGVLEVRNMYANTAYVDLLITQVSPRLGIAAGFISQDESNRKFQQSEIDKIAFCIKEIQDDVRHKLGLQSEQIDLLNRKLDEVISGSQRFGRKDWINFTSGTITGAIMNATIDVNTATDLLSIINDRFSWLFVDVLPLILNTPQ